MPFLTSPVTTNPSQPKEEAWGTRKRTGDVSSSISTAIYRRPLGFYGCRRDPTRRSTPTTASSPPPPYPDRAAAVSLLASPPRPPRPASSADARDEEEIRPGRLLLSIVPFVYLFSRVLLRI
ncbi:hypothetical protein EJB05_37326, partial [Eragrostis curvula]